MQDIELTKRKIIGLVEGYKLAFASEYKAVIPQIKKNRDGNLHRTGKITGKGADVPERPINEYPETLFTILHTRLDEQEKNWFFNNQETSKKAARWFAMQFPEFSRVEKV